MKKLIALLLIACLLMTTFSGCGVLLAIVDGILESESLFDDSYNFSSTKVDGTDNAVLQYALDQDLIDLFYEKLEQSEEMAIAGEDLEAAEQLIEELDEVYMELVDQYQIAYVYYCLDQSDEAMKQRYMDCVDIVTEAEAAYNTMCKNVYLSETPIRDQLFEDWTQKEIDMLLAYNEEIARLEKRNSELTVEFRELGDYDFEEGMIPLYNELVRNNNRIAEIYGYENYYVYAYDMIYQRDYEMDQIYQMRQYVARYMPEACLNATERFEEAYDALSASEQDKLSELIYTSYDGMSKNYVNKYIASLPDSSRKMLNDMFDRERAIFTEYYDAYEGAFTTWIDGEPFCYFGPGYNNTETVIHELGHYYGSSYVEPFSAPMDLSETQSQGNEWMYINYLQQELSEELYEAVVEYRMSSDIGYIICFVMVDEFEERVYHHENAGNLTLEEYDAIMESVARSYGGIDMITSDIMDVQTYWKMVVLESPVYYISYAVSGIAAINLYTIAQSDIDSAEESLRVLMEEPLEEEGFLANILHAGLTGPFEETVYEQLYRRYGK